MGARLATELLALRTEVQRRLARAPLRVNEYGFDPHGLNPQLLGEQAFALALLYRFYFRVQVHGSHRIPRGRAIVAANRAGGALALEAAMLGMALLLELEPPRIARAVLDRSLGRLPWWSVLSARLGAVDPSAESCARLLERDEVLIVFPEADRGTGTRGSAPHRYQLGPFDGDFAALAVRTQAPIVPVALVQPDAGWPRLLGGWGLQRAASLLGLERLPLPQRMNIRIGEPMHPNGNGESLAPWVERARDRIALLIEEQLAPPAGPVGAVS
jgi:1-acyl-sn-glycerol-3-phosphate acyltransferase